MSMTRLTSFVVSICLGFSGGGRDAVAQTLREHVRATKPAASTSWLPLAEAGSSRTVSVTGDLNAGQEIAVTTPGIELTRLSAPDGAVYDRLTIPGGGAAAPRVGSPEMPFTAFYLEIPYGVDVSFELAGDQPASLGTGFHLFPGQPDHLVDAAPAPFAVDRRAYAEDGFVPEAPVSIVRTGFIRGRRVALVRVYPARYNPATTELQAFGTVTFRLVLTGDTDPSGAHHRARLANVDSEQSARRLIRNYEPIAHAGDAPPDRTTTTDPAVYVIIVADALYEEVLPLAEWKRKKGFDTRVVRATDIYNRPGQITAGHIMQFIRTAFWSWDPAPSYVLFVGDHQDLPAHPLPLGESGDLPYALVDDPWLPDLAIGRLPVHTPAECATLVDKILRYDRTPDPGDWYRSLLSAAHFEDPPPLDQVDFAHFNETVMTVYQFLVNAQGWTGYTALRAPFDTWDPGQAFHWTPTFGSNAHLMTVRDHHWGSTYPDPVPQWIVDQFRTMDDASTALSTAINAGVGLVLYDSHGGPGAWTSLLFDHADAEALENGAMTPVVLSLGCQTADFTNETGGQPADCIAETLLKHPSGGGIAYYGSTMVYHAQNGIELLYGMLAGLWPEFDPAHVDDHYPPSMRLGEAMNFGICYKQLYLESALDEVRTFVLLGDPGLMLRTRKPKRFRVEYPLEVPRVRPVDVRLRVFDGHDPVVGARVAISMPYTSQSWIGFTDERGICVLSDIELLYAGSYDLVISAHNYVPHETAVTAADVLIVRPDGSSPYRTIQSAVDMARDWDLIELAPGTYTGRGNTNVSFRGKRITVRSQTRDPEDCVIDCQGSGRGFSFRGGEDGFSVLEGVTIINGDALGGGIYCGNSSPTIKHCRIMGNATSTHGAGLACVRSFPKLYGCVLSGNVAGARGTGGAVYCDQSSPLIVNSTIVGNTAAGLGGGLHCVRGSDPEFVNTIMWGNTSGVVGHAVFHDPSSTVTFKYSDVPAIDVAGLGETYWGDGNIDAHPLLVDIDGEDDIPGTLDDDPRLRPLSPCVDVGAKELALPDLSVDMDGNPRVVNGLIDMGAFERQ